MQHLYSTLIQELHQYAKNHQFQRAVLGVSGGLDSAVALCIAVRAFGPKNVTALILPEVGLTSNDDIKQATLLAEHFGCEHYYQPINNFMVDYNFVTWDKTSEANTLLKTRIRSNLLKHYAEAHNALFIGTANKSDLELGLGTEDGELAGEILVLGDLYKSTVMELAEFIGLPEALIKQEASRLLKPHQTDEDDLGGKWNHIDDILKQLKEGVDPESLIEKGLDSLMVHRILRLVQQNESRKTRASILDVGSLKGAIKKAREAEASSMS